jgi:ribosome-associated toxin RatA of RatAB toxin-antitoxin module
MRNVKLSARVAADTGPCFERIRDFARYPELVNVIRAVTVYPPDLDGTERSDWEVYFRNGILRWSEQDALDRADLRIKFRQIDGDFDYFAGHWAIAWDPGDGSDGSGAESCIVTFESDFDFGIPSLAGILDPVAERVFKETIARVLTGLFGEIEVIGDPVVTRSLAQEQQPVPSGMATAGRQ